MRKCPYCDFNSHQPRTAIDEKAYIEALLEDLQADLELTSGRGLHSLFIGGGTPSLFSDTSIRHLLQAVAARVSCPDDMEITLEANPGTADTGHFRGYRQAGVNRLSMGVQSFEDEKLKALGRIHNAAEALQAYAMARQAGFDTINLDLMFGLPQQSHRQGLHDLQQAIDLQPEHISWYQLTLEPNTAFANNPPVLPQDDELAYLAEAGQTLLADAGYERYEVSAYARPGQQCQHNLNYWRFGDYVGIGAGAHGKISHLQRSDLHIRRFCKQRAPGAYLQAVNSGHFVSSQESVACSQRPFEFMLNALRLTQGFTVRQYEQSSGCCWQDIQKEIRDLLQCGLLHKTTQGKICPTSQGQLFLNDLMQRFISDEA